MASFCRGVAWPRVSFDVGVAEADFIGEDTGPDDLVGDRNVLKASDLKNRKIGHQYQIKQKSYAQT